MKKIKLLFPLLGTSALAVTPALTAQTKQFSQPNNSTSGKHVINYNNDTYWFLNGKTDEYYYNDSTLTAYTEANLNFTLTSMGATELAKASIASSAHTGEVIMTFFNTKLLHFDNLYAYSYLNEIEGSSDNANLMQGANDKDAYSDFMNNMAQPASIVAKLEDMYNNHEKLPQVAVRFHYNFHTFADDDFDVSFTIVK